MVKLDIARNRILTAGLVFSMVSTCFTLGTLVSGVFGGCSAATLGGVGGGFGAVGVSVGGDVGGGNGGLVAAYTHDLSSRRRSRNNKDVKQIDVRLSRKHEAHNLL